MYLKAAVCTVLAWFIGLVADANINFGDPQGFLCLRVLLPVLAMGICLLRAIKEQKDSGDKKPWGSPKSMLASSNSPTPQAASVETIAAAYMAAPPFGYFSMASHSFYQILNQKARISGSTAAGPYFFRAS